MVKTPVFITGDLSSNHGVVLASPGAGLRMPKKKENTQDTPGRDEQESYSSGL